MQSSEFSKAISPVFSVTRSFRKSFLLLNIYFVKTVIKSKIVFFLLKMNKHFYSENIY